jgi:hypothetical protein
MAKEADEDRDDRGAVVLQPEPPARGTFALLIPGDMSWQASSFGGALRLDFRPMRPRDRAARARTKGKP